MLDDDLLVKRVEKSSSAPRPYASDIGQSVDKMVEDATHAVGLTCTEGVVWTADFEVFGFHAEHDRLRIGNQARRWLQ